MRIVFMGTPEYAVRSLEGLLSAGHEVAAVFTREDRPVGRKMKLTPPPVKQAALDRGIPVYQPATFKGGAMMPVLEALAPEVIVVVAYGLLLSEAVLKLPRYGCLNVHASLLPKYRGASPINAAILQGERETGVCIMQMEKGMDTGAVLYRLKTPVEPDETYGSLNTKLMALGAQAICEALPLLEEGGLTPEPQDDGAASYAPLIRNEDARISFAGEDALGISRKIRAYDPVPGAYAFLGETRLRLFSPVMTDGGGEPGRIVESGKTGVRIACREGAVEVRELQAPGGKRMQAVDFFRGHQDLLGERFS